MRLFFISTLILLSTSLLAQWQGDTSQFIIFPDSVQLNDTASGTSYISSSSKTIVDATWQIDVNIKNGTSSSNLAYIHLVSDLPTLDGNGYYLVVGNTADEVSLYRQDGGSGKKIIDGVDKRIDTKPMIVSIKATRSANGLWTLYTKLPSEDAFTEEGNAIDDTYLSSSYFGLKAKYTSTRAKETSFYHISITGEAFKDNVPPRLDSVVVLTRHKANFYFNEVIKQSSISMREDEAKLTIDSTLVMAHFSSSFLEYDSTSLSIEAIDTSENSLMTTSKIYYSPFEVSSTELIDANTLSFELNKVVNAISKENITINGIVPKSVSKEDDTFIALLSAALSNHSTNTLIIKDITDHNGDSIKVYTEDLLYLEGEFRDIVFNEIMADPTPTVGNLPEVEYLELYNNTPYDIDLKEWQIVKDDKTYDFPEFTFRSQEYLIIGSTSALEELSDDINKVTLSSFPALNNTGMTLMLQDKLGTLIDFVSYKKDWHSDAFKADGGFSLERIDINNPSELDNWTSTCSTNGGTPGTENCAKDENPDLENPTIINAYALDQTWLLLEFSEPILNDELNNTSYYHFSDGIDINSTLVIGTLPMSTQVMISLASTINKEQVYTLTVEGVSDLSANKIEEIDFNIAVCRLPESNDIVINELMPVPLSGEQEYVEIHNTTEVPFDLSKLKISRKDADGAWETGKSLAASTSLFLPNDYLVLSSDGEALLQQYDIIPENSIDITSMPSLGNESGNIGLLLENGTIIDQVNYNDEWHSPLLSNNKGVALERLSSNMPSDESSNWFSASALENYGTPGKENSQSSNVTATDKDIEVTPEVFSPDGDGTDDFTTIKVSNKYEGGNARVQIFNQRGIAVVELINNALLGSYDNIRWDGTDAEGKRCPMGPYIIWVEIITSDGNVITEKLECVISTRFN